MNKKLKSLSEHNIGKLQARTHARWGEPCPNGIACPNCGNELWDTHPNIFLTSDPLQKNVNCTGCGYTGLRVA